MNRSLNLRARLSSTVLRAMELTARIRPDERRNAAGAFLSLFGFMAGHAVLETARDALFLGNLSAARLPWVYLAIAATALALTPRLQAIARRIPAANEMSAWLLFGGLGTLLFWLAIPRAGSWIFFALYVWSGVLASMVVIRFWILLGTLFTVTQAKRIYAAVGSGSVAGAIVGSALALLLSDLLPPRHLVLGAACLFLIASAAPRLFRSLPPSDTTTFRRLGDVAEAARSIWGQPYLRRVTSVILLATITFTLVDFVFKSAADLYVPTRQLDQFFSSTYLALNVASLLIQVFVVSRVLRRVSVTAAISLVPALIALSAVAFAAGGGLVLALVLKFSDGTMRHSLYRTGAEVLFFPLATDLRARVKSVIDVVGQRGGQALGSVLILMVLSTSASLTVFAVLTVCTALAWLALSLDLRGHYLRAFRDTLQRDDTSDRVQIPDLDGASLEALLATLNAPDEDRVLGALDLLVLKSKTDAIPPLILYHPSSRVVERALEVLRGSGRTDIEPFTRRLLGHSDPDIRAAALRALLVLGIGEAEVREAMNDPAEEVRTTAMVALVGRGWEPPDGLNAEITQAVKDRNEGVTRAAALTTHAVGTAAHDAILIALLEGPDPEIAKIATRAMGTIRHPVFIEPLINSLRVHAIRAEVRSALTELGPSVLPRLAQALEDGTQDHRVRRHVPRAIAAFRTQEAAQILLRSLTQEPDGQIRFKILRALGRWRVDQPRLPLDRTELDQALEQNLQRGQQLLTFRKGLDLAISSDPELNHPLHHALMDLVRDKQAHVLERAFRLLNLIHDDEDFRRIYLAFQSPAPTARAGSRELVELLVVPPTRGPLLRLIDDFTDPEPSDQASDDATSDYRVLLERIAESGVSSVGAFAQARLESLGL